MNTDEHQDTLSHTHAHWRHTTRPHVLGDVLYVQTPTSRRKATVIGSKPGAVLLKWSEE